MPDEGRPSTPAPITDRLRRSSVTPSGLFVYGTLQFPEVLVALLGRVPERGPASARGWRVAVLPEHVYPGLVVGDGVAHGYLLNGLDPDEWRLLDAFEGPMYVLSRLDLVGGGHGCAYVCRPDVRAGSDDWSAEDFRVRHLSAYAERCAAWRESYVKAAPLRGLGDLVPMPVRGKRRGSGRR